jgi:hypothetical protein
MGKQRQQQDSAYQIGPEIPLHGILMIVVSCCTGGEDVWADFFTLRNWRCSGQPGNNQQSYGQIDVTVGFSRSERSRNNLGRSSNCTSTLALTDDEDADRHPYRLRKNDGDADRHPCRLRKDDRDADRHPCRLRKDDGDAHQHPCHLQI